MRIVAIKLWELGLDILGGSSSGFKLLGAIHHGANIGGALSGGEVERTILGLTE
jgi:hypothetical protein